MTDEDNQFAEFHGGVDDEGQDEEAVLWPDDGECPECGMPWCDLCNACHFCGLNEGN